MNDQDFIEASGDEVAGSGTTRRALLRGGSAAALAGLLGFAGVRGAGAQQAADTDDGPTDDLTSDTGDPTADSDDGATDDALTDDGVTDDTDDDDGVTDDNQTSDDDNDDDGIPDSIDSDDDNDGVSDRQERKRKKRR